MLTNTNEPGTTDVGQDVVAYQSDGKMVVAGYFYQGAYDFTVVRRYNVDGSQDTSFGDDGIVTIDFGTPPILPTA